MGCQLVDRRGVLWQRYSEAPMNIQAYQDAISEDWFTTVFWPALHFRVSHSQISFLIV